jgi:ribosomal protein S18 acetylase RimI-like enzyme
MNPPTIRVAVPDDAAAIARVLVDTYRVAHRGQVPDRLLDFPPIDEAYAESERNWRRALNEIASTPQSRERIFIAVEGERVVGLGMGVPRGLPELQFAGFAGEVVCLYVAVTHQRRGIGSQLLRAIFQHLAHVGLLPIAIECLSANLPARRFYEAMGGRNVGDRTRNDDDFLLPATVYGWSEVR